MLRLFYVCFFVTSGVSIPFFPAFLRQIGLSGRQVSVLLAIPPALQIGVPLLWGWLADRTHRPDRVLRGLCLGAFLASLPVILVRSMAALFAVYLAQQVFAVSILSLADSLAVEKSRRGGHYGAIRACGSASFITVCLVVGWWLDLRGLHGGDVLVPILISSGFALSFLAALTLVGHGGGERPHARDVRLLLADRRFRLLLPVAGLHWAALVPYHGFLGILLHDRGFASTITGYAFFVGVSAEIAVFLLFSRLRARFALNRLLAASFVVSALRWWLVAYLRSAPLVVALQIAHGFSFGVFWAAAMAWIAECVPTKLRATGQVLFTTATGLGSMVGLLCAGSLYDATGGAGLSFALAGALDLVPLALLLLVRRPADSKPGSDVTSPSPIMTG
jgi:MFS transporter, PPP family, 3-phenylpropionic acid transporter